MIGDPATHGKGTVQTLMNLGQRLFGNNRQNYGALKVTLQQFYLPDGESTQLKGVLSDIILPSLTSKMDVGEGDLKYALEHDTVPVARHNLYSMVPNNLLDQLRKKSAARVEQDEEFTDLLRRVELYVTQKDQEAVSLEEEAFLARRKELDSQKEEEEELEQQIEDAVIFRDNYYNTEVMNIMADYIDGLRKENLAVAN